MANADSAEHHKLLAVEDGKRKLDDERAVHISIHVVVQACPDTGDSPKPVLRKLK